MTDKVTEIREAINRLEELKDSIYEALNEMEEVLRGVAPEVYAMSKSYWLPLIDGALENRGNWLGGSTVSYIDAILALEELELEEMMKEQEN